MNNNTSGQSAAVSRGVQKEIHREYSETAPDSVKTSRLLRHHIRERECDGVRGGGRCVCWHHTSFASRGGASSVWCGAGESSVRRLQPQDNEIPLDRCVCVSVCVRVSVCMSVRVYVCECIVCECLSVDRASLLYSSVSSPDCVCMNCFLSAHCTYQCTAWVRYAILLHHTAASSHRWD